MADDPERLLFEALEHARDDEPQARGRNGPSGANPEMTILASRIASAAERAENASERAIMAAEQQLSTAKRALVIAKFAAFVGLVALAASIIEAVRVTQQ